MLIYRRTSLLESSAQTLVNTVNCVGVMGKGVAHEFKLRDPEMFAAYKRICDDKKLTPGKLWLWRGREFWTLNFPTKLHWRNPSRLEWIEAGLAKFVSGYEKLGIQEISFPRLGCGNGGLDWADVKPLMEHYLKSLPIAVYVHDYSVDIGIPEHLESIAARLRRELPTEGSFVDFVSALKRAVELTNGQLSDLRSGEPFTAEFSEDDELTIEKGTGSWTFSEDDLWSIWISLQRGLLTGDRAGWFTSSGAKQLVSLLGLLPSVRPIEVEGIEGGPQLAAEYRARDRKSAAAPSDPPRQLEMSWR